MSSMIAGKLAGILEQEAAVYEDLLKLSQKKKDVIVEGKVSELESMTRLEQSLVLQVRKLEDTREELLQELSVCLGIAAEEIHVSGLTGKIPEKEIQRLNACRDRISGILHALKNTNELNVKLIKNSLDYIDFSINLFTAADGCGNNYVQSGRVGDSKKRNLFDVKL